MIFKVKSFSSETENTNSIALNLLLDWVKFQSHLGVQIQGTKVCVV